MRRHLELKIYGRVTGVGFRWSARKKAGELGIVGFARNEDEGYLYMEAEGEKDDLDKFLAWCHKGPMWARVDKVEAEEGEVKGYAGFEIS